MTIIKTYVFSHYFSKYIETSIYKKVKSRSVSYEGSIRDHRKGTLSFTVSRYKRIHAAPQVCV